MNLSLKRRVALSFVTAIVVVAFLSITVFYHLNSLHENMRDLSIQESSKSLAIFNVRVNVLSILKSQRKIILEKKATAEQIEEMTHRCEELISTLNKLDSVYRADELSKLFTAMKATSENLILLLQKSGLFRRGTGNMSNVTELTERLLDYLTDILSEMGKETRQKDEGIKKILIETKRNMMVTLIIGFLGTIILALVIPGKLALPFKKIKDAIRELQECNFDVSIYYSQNDEIGEIAKEMNKMIHSLKVFEELRANRINVENRKFDALANMVKRPVLVANAEGKVIYMNNRIYSLLEVQSEDVIGKDITDKNFPVSIINCIELAIKRRSKIENEEVIISKKKEILESDSHSFGPETPLMEEESHVSDILSEKEKIEKSEEVEILFQGFANIIPIRGKESSLDYYLMVLSTEVFS